MPVLAAVYGACGGGGGVAVAARLVSANDPAMAKRCKASVDSEKGTFMVISLEWQQDSGMAVAMSTVIGWGEDRPWQQR